MDLDWQSRDEVETRPGQNLSIPSRQARYGPGPRLRLGPCPYSVDRGHILGPTRRTDSSHLIRPMGQTGRLPLVDCLDTINDESRRQSRRVINTDGPIETTGEIGPAGRALPWREGSSLLPAGMRCTGRTAAWRHAGCTRVVHGGGPMYWVWGPSTGVPVLTSVTPRSGLSIRYPASASPRPQYLIY